MIEDTEAKPRWRKITDFPIVAGLIVFVAVFGAMTFYNRLTYLIPESAVPNTIYWIVKGLTMPLLVVAVYRWIVRRVGEDRGDVVPLDRRSGDAWRGALLAFVMMSAIVVIVWLLDGYRVIGWGGGTSFVRTLFLVSISAGVVEELLLRGIIFRYVEQLAGSWFALAFSSALFGLGHWFNPNATVLTTAAIAVEGGVLLGGAYMLTRNLWLAIGIHAGWNFTQGFIWDVPVSGFAMDGLVEAQPAGSVLISGGAFGMEGSVIGFAVATVVGVWLVVQAVRRGHIIRPWWVRRRLAREAKA